MTINPLFPYIPAFASFLLYGWITGGLFMYGREGRKGCLFAVGFWYAFAVWVLFFLALLSVQDTMNIVCFAIGFGLPYSRRIVRNEAIRAPFEIVVSLWDTCMQFLQGMRQKLSQARQEKPHGQDTNQHTRHTDQSRHSTPPPNPNDLHEAMKREQARREAEAQAKRAEQARQKDQAEQKERERQEKPNSNTTDNRTPEDVLGLKDGWTPEDLKTAYKREAGRTHPDKWIGKPESIREAMEAEYKNIQEAYRKLKNTG
jgi:type IV secretory pathway VirB10-like protein